MNREAREDAERYIKERATDYFQQDRSAKGYICPICGSGSGVNGTGITENPNDKGHFTCWGGDCFRNADIFEIIGKQYGLTDFNEIFNKACELFRVTVDDVKYSSPQSKPDVQKQQSEQVQDFTNFFKRAAENLTQTDYYRGISFDTLRKFRVGFIPDWKAKPTAPASPRLIIPVWTGGYLARDTRSNLTEQQTKYSKMRVGKTRLFNPSALRQNVKPVFIVEGEIDALSIIDAGGQAVGLGSVANIGKLIEAIKEELPKVPLILQLDNDVRGQQAERRLIEAFRNLKFFSYMHYSLPDEFKDANEFLMTDRENFIDWVRNVENFNYTDIKEKSQDKAVENLVVERDRFFSERGSQYLNDFEDFVLKNKFGGISTGFENLDKLLDGGLYPGLYVIGANSSLGKTTLILQIADSIAQSGRGVLIFSLEMSKFELLAKTFSRMSFIKSLEQYQSACYAKTTRNVLLSNYNNEFDRRIIAEAMNDYSDWGRNIYITEGIGDIGVFQIKDKIEEFRKFTGEIPVVVVDYLQILSPYSVKMTDKQNVDKNITELKRLSRDFNIPVLGVSSFNRESYSAPVSMASFKESGAIEYSSDVLIGLQYNGWDYRDGESDIVRTKRLREVRKKMEEAARNLSYQDMQLKILKNRNGLKGDLLFDFFPAFNYFRSRKEDF
ncbi:MAG: toprim domain-containing protein [Synergistaceae bacterium]|nr:toprim domain-containing protein [Synergistaceae bacterium]MBR0074132.1 toprim domain-containing protein [Synergistaceae bacterium]